MIQRPVVRRRFLTLLAIALFFPMLLAANATAAPTKARPLRANTGPLAVNVCPQLPHRLSCLAKRRPQPRTPAALGTATGFAGYGPADLRSAYRIPTSTITATVAIVDAYNAPSVESDLAAYRAHYGLPPCTTSNGCFRKVNQNGASSPLPPDDNNWAGETTLDTQMVSAVCPSCHILLVESNDDDSSGQPNMEMAVQRATLMGAKYVSMSWGGAETSDETSLDSAYLNNPAATYVASAGDNDYGTSWPAVDSRVISVGGTTLVRASNARGWTDSVWGYNDGTGTGSGCSQYEAQPAWQNSTAITALCANRAMNDLAIVADPNTGVAVYQGGSWWIYGGTSAGAPMIAALYAILGPQATTPTAQYLYNHPADFIDVTDNANGSCANALCQGTVGWDGPTGVGVPQGVAGLGAVGQGTISAHNPGTVTSYVAKAISVDTRAIDSNGQPLHHSATGLPPGTWMRSDGWIVGAPSRTGSYLVTATAQDSVGSVATVRFRWNVTLHRIYTQVVPHITGVLQRGHAVYVTFGSFRMDSPTGPVIRPAGRVQWYVDGHPIPYQVHSYLVIPAGYYHHRIQFRLSTGAANYAPYTYLTQLSAPIS